MMNDKKRIRKTVFASRKAASDAEIRSNSDRLFEQVYALDIYKNADTVFAYMDYNHEVMTVSFIEQCWRDNKTVAVPRVNGDVMNFYKITALDQLAPGCMGIPEPTSQNPVDEQYETALMIVPGVAFDPNRNRVGYGGGFYDKYLEQHSQHPTLAVAFEFQIFDEVPSDVHDRKPDILVTQERCIR